MRADRRWGVVFLSVGNEVCERKITDRLCTRHAVMPQVEGGAAKCKLEIERKVKKKVDFHLVTS